jgi:hypothetical protein
LTEEKQILICEVKTLKKDQTNHKDLTHSLEQKLEKEIDRFQFKCDYCYHNSKTQTALRKHQQTHNCKDQNNQVELNQFQEYSCYYCYQRIKSKNDLEKHKPVCHASKDFASYPCDEYPEEAEMGPHRTTYHELGTFKQDL